MIVTNRSDISLPLAVWLLHDEYDYLNETNYISATTLMKPIRHIVLPSRVPADEMVMDVEDFIASGLGKSMHDSIEKAWIHSYGAGLKKLGYPQGVIDRVLINPTPEQLAAVQDAIPVYLEQRVIRKFKGFTIGGKFDMVIEGILQDTKSTTAYTWLFGGKDDDYRKQGSIYRWLNPEKVTEDFIRINFIFTDWQKMQAKSNPKYPPRRVMHKDIPLWSLEQTEEWISHKLEMINRFRTAPEPSIPECTDEELWQSDPKYKYYSDPLKTSGRSTRNFDDQVEARNFMLNEKGGKGVIRTIPGEVQRCNYCSAFPICTQKDKYFHD